MSASKRTADKSAKSTEWLVYRVGGPKAAFVGHVMAPSRETALARAYDQFGITSPTGRKRVIVQQMGKA